MYFYGREYPKNTVVVCMARFFLVTLVPGKFCSTAQGVLRIRFVPIESSAVRVYARQESEASSHRTRKERHHFLSTAASLERRQVMMSMDHIWWQLRSSDEWEHATTVCAGQVRRPKLERFEVTTDPDPLTSEARNWMSTSAWLKRR